MNKSKEDNKKASDSAYVQDQRAEQFETATVADTPKASFKRPTQKYSLLAIADRLETQYLQGVQDIAVAEAVKALRKLAE